MRVSCYLLASLSFAYYAYCVVRVGWRSSILYFWALLGLFFFLCGALPLIFYFFALPFFVFGCCFLVFLFFAVRGSRQPQETPEILVLLGARSDGTLPEALLSERVKLAAHLMKREPHFLCILSGGRVFREQESEARLLQRAMLCQGIEANRLILEEESRTTVENFSHLLPLLGREVERIGVITSSFHAFRASLIARSTLPEKKLIFYSAPAPAFFLPHLYLREFFTFSVDFLGGRLSLKKK